MLLLFRNTTSVLQVEQYPAHQTQDLFNCRVTQVAGFDEQGSAAYVLILQI